MAEENGTLEVSEKAKSGIQAIVKNELEPTTKSINDVTATVKAVEKNVSTLGEAVSGFDNTVKEINENIGKLAKQGDEIEGKLKATNATPMKKGYKTMHEALTAAILSKGVQDQIQAIVKNDGKQTEPLTIKAAVTMGLNTTLETGDTVTSITSDTGIVSAIRKRQERYLANVSVGSLSGKYAMWVEETDEQGVPIFIGEGVTKTQVSVKYIEKTKAVGKIPVYGKVTTEMMADAPQFATYIQNNLLKRTSIATETQLWLGDGTGDNLTGLKTYASAFSAGAMAASIPSANEFDVISAIATQVEIANGIPNALGVHPSTLQAMKAIKATDGTPLYKQYVANASGEIVVDGMKLISTTAVPAGEFIGGDMTVANVLFREALNIQVGLDGNDFIQNKKTILVEQRLVQFVSANDTQVIVKGDFATAKAALATV